MKGIVATFKNENVTLIITDTADAHLAKVAIQAFAKKRGRR